METAGNLLSNGPRATICPGRDRIGPFQLFPAYSGNTVALDGVSKQSVWRL